MAKSIPKTETDMLKKLAFCSSKTSHTTAFAHTVWKNDDGRSSIAKQGSKLNTESYRTSRVNKRSQKRSSKFYVLSTFKQRVEGTVL